jgi:hypothetical protein
MIEREAKNVCGRGDNDKSKEPLAMNRILMN